MQTRLCAAVLWERLLLDSKDNDQQANIQGTELHLLVCYSDAVTMVVLLPVWGVSSKLQNVPLRGPSSAVLIRKETTEKKGR